jgi:hypothetical protein
MKKLSDAAHRIEGQKMFQILAKTKILERQGKKIFHFEFGDPDFNYSKKFIGRHRRNSFFQRIRRNEGPLNRRRVKNPFDLFFWSKTEWVVKRN